MRIILELNSPDTDDTLMRVVNKLTPVLQEENLTFLGTSKAPDTFLYPEITEELRETAGYLATAAQDNSLHLVMCFDRDLGTFVGCLGYGSVREDGSLNFIPLATVPVNGHETFFDRLVPRSGQQVFINPKENGHGYH